MADKVGDVFDGYITGVAPFGMFVELIEHYVEGLVHVSTMADDYYRFREQTHTLFGENTQEDLPPRRQGARAGRPRRHGAAADRSRPRGRARDGPARRAPPRAAAQLTRGRRRSSARARPSSAASASSGAAEEQRPGKPRARRRRIADDAHRRRHRRPHRSRQEHAGAGADRHRSRSAEGREGARHHHRARASRTPRSATRASRSSTCRATSDSCRTMLAGRRRHRLRAADRRRRRVGDAADARALRHLPAAAHSARHRRADQGRSRRRGHARARAAGSRELVEGIVSRGRAGRRRCRRGPATGLDELREALAGAGRARAGARPVDGAARLPIDRAFSMQGFGTVVTGTLVSGTVRVDDELALRARRPRASSARRAGARASRDEAVAGQRTAINLGGIEVGDIARGQTLMTPGDADRHAPRRRRRSICCRRAKPLKHGARVRLHHGTSEVLGRVSIAGAVRDRDRAGRRSAASALRLEAPAALTRGDRFILRAYSPPVTIGGGIVLDSGADAARHSHRGGRARRWSAAGSRPTATRRCAAMIDAAGLAGIAPSSLVLARRRGAGTTAAPSSSARSAQGMVAPAIAWSAARHLDDRVGAAARTGGRVSQGPPDERRPAARRGARNGCSRRSRRRSSSRSLDDLKAARRWSGAERLALRRTRPPSPAPTIASARAIIEAYRAGGLKPPDAAALEATREGAARGRREGDGAAAAREGADATRHDRLPRRGVAAVEGGSAAR